MYLALSLICIIIIIYKSGLISRFSLCIKLILIIFILNLLLIIVFTLVPLILTKFLRTLITQRTSFSLTSFNYKNPVLIHSLRISFGFVSFFILYPQVLISILSRSTQKMALYSYKNIPSSSFIVIFSTFWFRILLRISTILMLSFNFNANFLFVQVITYYYFSIVSVMIQSFIISSTLDYWPIYLFGSFCLGYLI